MSVHVRLRAAACAAITVVSIAAGCKGDRSQPAGRAAGGAAHADSSTGEPVVNVPHVAMRQFNGDPQVAVAGRQLFIQNNCYGCHGGLGGGAMGPSLRDDQWLYGGTDSAITASIHDGRPAGMPRWAGTIPDSNIRKLVTYIRSMRTRQEPTFFFSPTDTTTHARL